jgi:hypothetical protein
VLPATDQLLPGRGPGGCEDATNRGAERPELAQGQQNRGSRTQFGGHSSSVEEQTPSPAEDLLREEPKRGAKGQPSR